MTRGLALPVTVGPKDTMLLPPTERPLSWTGGGGTVGWKDQSLGSSDRSKNKDLLWTDRLCYSSLLRSSLGSIVTGFVPKGLY